MPQRYHATHAFAVFCFTLALYLSLGGWLQGKFGLWGITFNEMVILLLPSLVYTKILGLDWSKVFPLALPEWREILLVILLTALVIAPVELLILLQERYWPLPEGIQDFYENLVARQTWQQGFRQFLTLALVPAICEELFFRGFLQSLFQPRFGVFLSTFITSVFFALAHVNPWYFIYYLILGLFFGWLRYWRGNLSLPILAHLLNNLYSLYGS